MATRRTYALGAVDEVGRRVRVIASTRAPVKGVEVDANGKETERLESLESWDLSRYEKNNAVFDGHDDKQPPIGWGEELVETDAGLEGWLRFAPASLNKLAEERFTQVKAGLIRGISVGWEYGERTDEERDGQKVAVFRKNKLTEFSLVSLPADEDALVKSDAGEEVRRFDYVGRLGKVARTQVGGIKVPARLTRTGVLEYRLPDGSVRRELRHPDEVFNADSIASLQSATVTDLEHHRAFIDSTTWKDAALGHAENIRRDGKYIVGDLLIQDARAVVDVENKRLADISCGYSCKLDMTPGEWEGERYDAVQRRVRYNHVAVLPPGRGRAGTDVGIRLDSSDAVCVEETIGEPIMKVIKLDGREVEYGSEAHIKHLEDAHLADVAKFDAKEKELTKANDELQAKLDAGDKSRKKREEDEEKEEEERKKRSIEEDEERKKREKSRIRRALRAARIMEEDDEEKMDSLLDLSERDLMVTFIKRHAGHEKFDGKDEDGKDRSDAYVEALFDVLSKEGKRADGVDSVVLSAEKAKRADAADPVTTASQKARERAENAWKTPLLASKE